MTSHLHRRINELTRHLNLMIPTLETFVNSGFRPSDSLEEQLVKQVDEKAATLRALMYSVLPRNMEDRNFALDVAHARRVLSEISRLREELGNLPNAPVGGKRKRKTLKKRKTKRRRT